VYMVLVMEAGIFLVKGDEFLGERKLADPRASGR